jgi:hypothetical protein
VRGGLPDVYAFAPGASLFLTARFPPVACTQPLLEVPARAFARTLLFVTSRVSLFVPIGTFSFMPIETFSFASTRTLLFVAFPCVASRLALPLLSLFWWDTRRRRIASRIRRGDTGDQPHMTWDGGEGGDAYRGQCAAH